jgi:hypothetical protein
MDKRDAHRTRLLKLAATAKTESAMEAPFGFDTRVVALWRGMKPNGNGDVVRFVRRVALTALAITILAAFGTYRQLDQDDESGEPLTNDYALVDSEIQSQFAP